MNRTKLALGLSLLLLSAAIVCRETNGQGIALPAVGAINQSMAGASVAAPLDAMGSLYWNPAGIGALPSSEMSFGLGLLLPSTRVDSAIPLLGVAGSTVGEPGIMPIPTAAFVQRDPDSPWTYGLGMYGIGGFATNYPTSLTNPVLMPPPFGQGHISATVEILQLAPTIAVNLTERLTIGFTPTIDLARFSAVPQFLAPPDVLGIYPSGASTRYTWGIGGSVGVLYTAPNGFNLGASIKSPQWFEKFRAFSNDTFGTPLTLSSSVDFPMIASFGGAYTGFERWTFATDLRYFDYLHTEGFRGAGFNPDGSVAGLGWRNVYALATGAQFQATERLALRAGYAFNTNPISNSATFFNIPSPLITQHLISAGASYEFSPGCIASFSYTHAFQNNETGPIPTLPIPGSVTNFTSADLFIANVMVRF